MAQNDPGSFGGQYLRRGGKTQPVAGHGADELVLAGVVQLKIQKTGPEHHRVVEGFACGADLVQLAGIDKAEFPRVQQIGFAAHRQFQYTGFHIHPFQFFVPVLGNAVKTVLVVVGIHLQREGGGAVGMFFLQRGQHGPPPCKSKNCVIFWQNYGRSPCCF